VEAELLWMIMAPAGAVLAAEPGGGYRQHAYLPKLTPHEQEMKHFLEPLGTKTTVAELRNIF